MPAPNSRRRAGVGDGLLADFDQFMPRRLAANDFNRGFTEIKMAGEEFDQLEISFAAPRRRSDGRPIFAGGGFRQCRRFRLWFDRDLDSPRHVQP